VERILILGSCGSGKSHLARQLGAILHLPVIHLDQLFWRSDWIEIPRTEWTGLVERECSRPKWIMEGNYTETFDLRLAACDTVIFLHLPSLLCLWRAIVRTYQYRFLSRPDVPPGCAEKLDLRFLRWILRYPHTDVPQILKKIGRLGPPQRVEILKSPREVTSFLESTQVSPDNVSAVDFGCVSS
jgi:adenylate kinase family enzyme